jgi:hypothetical protein
MWNYQYRSLPPFPRPCVRIAYRASTTVRSPSCQNRMIGSRRMLTDGFCFVWLACATAPKRRSPALAPRGYATLRGWGESLLLGLICKHQGPPKGNEALPVPRVESRRLSRSLCTVPISPGGPRMRVTRQNPVRNRSPWDRRTLRHHKPTKVIRSAVRHPLRRRQVAERDVHL